VESLSRTSSRAGTPLGATGSTAHRVQSVDRAMMLLRAVAATKAEDSTAARLAEVCGLNRATAWRILHTLETHGVVSCSRETGRWSVGVTVVDIARSAGVDALVASARPGLQRLSLQTGETAALAVPRADGLTYVDEVAPSSIVAATWLGQAVPLHATSTGKVLLAFGDPGAVARTAERGLSQFTGTTLTTRGALEQEVAQVRLRGFATCEGEYEASAWGVSAPVLDHEGRLLAVLSIWGPASRVTEARFQVLGPLVRRAASTLLGP
jgi:DNA-binding IclR family transcriptional regulator